ncbi:MAG: hypothetical protein SFT90_00655 [Rickettsiales bacterium]|nr:hypothetical protein [Rickettsiales bacterium]
MLDVKLFKFINDKTLEIKEDFSGNEKSIQKIFESNLESLLNIYFLETEFSTGYHHGGRIDTLGLDANNCPVVIEYKKNSDANVITQGLYYLDWLFDHQSDFRDLVKHKLGEEKANYINFAQSRLICISREFNKFDFSAIQHINKNIDLIKYRKFQDNVFYIETIDPKNIIRKPIKVLHNNKVNNKITIQKNEAEQEEKSRFENKVAKLLNWIEKQGGLVDKTKMLQNFGKHFDNRREREEAIQELIEREAIEAINIGEAGRKKTGYKIKIPT